jgi:hypothetical protein
MHAINLCAQDTFPKSDSIFESLLILIAGWWYLYVEFVAQPSGSVGFTSTSLWNLNLLLRSLSALGPLASDRQHEEGPAQCRQDLPSKQSIQKGHRAPSDRTRPAHVMSCLCRLGTPEKNKESLRQKLAAAQRRQDRSSWMAQRIEPERQDRAVGGWGFILLN